MTAQPSSRPSLLEKIRARGIRLTAQRALLMRILDDQDSFMDAAALLAVAKKRGARVDRATVYRTLAMLRSSGLLLPGGAGGSTNPAPAEPAMAASDELLLTCDRCGNRQPVAAGAPALIKRELRRCTGFEPRSVRLESSGSCRFCAAKMRIVGGPHGKHAR
jgi:Fur family ferric uptake transcriptional regulator